MDNISRKISTCSNGRFVFRHENIALPITIDNLDPQLKLGGNILFRKDSFHVCLLYIEDIINKNPHLKHDFKEDVTDDFCKFINEHDISLSKFEDTFYTVSQKELLSVIIMCSVTHINDFIDLVNRKYDLALDHTPTHVTLYTLQKNRGIFLYDLHDLQELAVKIDAPSELRGLLLS